MKKFAVVALLMSFHISGMAQSSITTCKDHGEAHFVFLDDFNYGSTKVGESVIVAEYDYTMVTDTLLNTRITDPYVLQISPALSKFSHRGKYTFDSGVDSVTVNNKQLIVFETKCFKKGYYPFIFDSWISNLSSGEYTFTGRLAAEDYMIKTPSPAIEWRMTGETKQISGYSANLAEGEIEGDTWSVWYTEDVPVSAGPWKISGLPGLVLSASDRRGTHGFEMTSIKDAAEPIVLSDYQYIKTTDEKYQRLLDQLFSDFDGFSSTHNRNSIKMEGNKEKRPLFKPLSR